MEEHEEEFVWPEYFPEYCPPKSAKITNGQVYRFVKQNPPTENDFISHRLLFKEKKFPNECEACGLSVLTDINDVPRMQRIFNPLRKMLIALGNLTPNAGKILSTPSKNANSHHTWWIPYGVEVSKMFQTIVSE